MHENLIVILKHPQKVSNIGGAVRAMKNMGLRRLRLVRPPPFAPADVLGIAHRSEDLLAALETFDTLDAALADAIFVAGTTARPRGTLARLSTPREAAGVLLARAASGPVALLFGPEDNGLTNEDLDRCHLALTIPADPAYPSLNLAQAVLLTAYELRLAAPTPAAPRPPHAPPATAAQLEQLFLAAERALWGIEFFKAQQARGVLRTLRALVHRAGPDAHEAKLLTAMCLEALAFLRRKGIEPAEPPDPAANDAPE
ncbi:MAG TPA: RNA methyltransferase [Roseiflexaceae bacterium]|nr:RNA methyltransferase [Roseiflexaceae bacterium]